MAATSTQSRVDKATDNAKEKLFQQLQKDMHKEFKKNGDKLVKQYGKTPMKKMALEKFNDTVCAEVTKRMGDVKYSDAKKIQNQFKSLSDTVTTEANKVDILMKGADVIFKKNTSEEGRGVKTSVEGTLQKCKTLVDKYVQDMERLDTLLTPTSWWSKFKRFFGIRS